MDGNPKKVLVATVTSSIDEQGGNPAVLLIDPAIIPHLYDFAAFADELQNAGLIEATSATLRAFLLQKHLYPLDSAPWTEKLEEGDLPMALIELPEKLPEPAGKVSDLWVIIDQTSYLSFETIEDESNTTYRSEQFGTDEVPALD